MQYADSCDGLYLRVRIGVVVRVYTIAGGTMPSADLLFYFQETCKDLCHCYPKRLNIEGEEILEENIPCLPCKMIFMVRMIENWNWYCIHCPRLIEFARPFFAG